MVPYSSPTTAPRRRQRDPNQTATLEDYWGNDDVGSETSYYGSYTNTTITWSWNEIQNEVERLFAKGKFFAFESSREFRSWFGGPKTPVKLFRARHGFQQMARIPCYRGVRTR
jgi:hypothetical protein